MLLINNILLLFCELLEESPELLTQSMLAINKEWDSAKHSTNAIPINHTYEHKDNAYDGQESANDDSLFAFFRCVANWILYFSFHFMSFLS